MFAFEFELVPPPFKYWDCTCPGEFYRCLEIMMLEISLLDFGLRAMRVGDFEEPRDDEDELGKQEIELDTN